MSRFFIQRDKCNGNDVIFLLLRLNSRDNKRAELNFSP